MFIKSMSIDGFKSYGLRTEINGFDPLFNAITGLNGSGKSNILDAICFVLGISNLSQVRATNLQELVYKNGQAGVTKATVTICFDNTDKKQSPIGYEQYEEVTICRQVIMGGRNKYMINGSSVQHNRVQDFFRSVQLNVNNPHFLIMQGRITKVLNMKPPEILAMIEEAAGTRMYESKKQHAEKTIEKKDAKLREMNEILNEEITPTLQKLKEERTQYLEFQKIQREIEHFTRLYVAYKFLSAEEASEKSKDHREKAQKDVENYQEKIISGEQKLKELENEIIQLQRIRDSETGGRMKELEQEVSAKEKLEVKASSKLKNAKDSINREQKNLKQIEKSLADDVKLLSTRENDAAKMDEKYTDIRERDRLDKEALLQAENRLQAISSGLYASESGENATLQEQLINAKASITNCKTETKQADMKFKHAKEELKKMEQEIKKTEAQFNKDNSMIEKIRKEVEAVKNQLSRLGYDEVRVNELQQRQQNLRPQVVNLTERISNFESRYPNLSFNYSEPERNFDHSSVKGPIGKLFKMNDPSTATALEVIAGGRLYNVVIDNEATGKKLLKNGRLQARVTFIPLNKIVSRPIEKNVVNFAQQLVGAENCQTALSLISFDKELYKAMEWVFGTVFVCKDQNTAKTIAFHPKIMRKAVTLDGDVFDPAGTLTGGARRQGGNILTQLASVLEIDKEQKQKSNDLKKIEEDLKILQKNANEYANWKQKYDVKNHEFELCQERIQQSTHYQLREEIDNHKKTMEESEATVKRCKETEKAGEEKVKELENKIKNSKALKETELKNAKKQLEQCKKAAEETSKKWSEKKQEEETLKLEVVELQKGIDATRQQIEETQNAIKELENQLLQVCEEAKQAKDDLSTAQADLKKQKEMLHAQNKEIVAKSSQKEAITKQINEAQLEVKQLEHKLNKHQQEAVDAQKTVERMLIQHEWIAEERRFFGQANTAYDFKANDPVECGKRIQKLEDMKTKLSKNVNMRAMNMLGKAEEQYSDLMRKKRIVENDKAKIETVIRELDEKKKEALLQAWESVNKDFGSIFSTVLPGTQAKLQPPDGMTVLEGLEVKVAFGDAWKESLTELSGGQRSLVALSLILALLLFKPAPIYILDEVDAALDLSHTQNIGNMLKTHFKHSQFIIVSLKDGMFNNANVLFTTKFVDGMSTVSRQTSQAASKKRKN